MHLTAALSLAAYLTTRQEAILNNWRTVCQNDPACNTAAQLNRQEFNNKVPAMLDALRLHLQQQVLDQDVKQLAAEHGLHRWQKGYVLHELLAEMQHLNRLLLQELRQFWGQHPTASPEQVALSFELMAWLVEQCVEGSVEQYTQLQQLAASSRVKTLQKALDELNELIRQRGELLRRSSHDLRSSFGIIKSAATLLEQVQDPERPQMLDMLNRNLTGVSDLVTELMDLARLEAGQEPVHIQTCDASQLLRDLVEAYQLQAQQQGLVLQADGPSGLMVETDVTHLQRIVQNLVLNALKHTDQGWVSVCWSQEGDYRWTLTVQDSGPGLPGSSSSNSLPMLLAPTLESTATFSGSTSEADRQEPVTVDASKEWNAKGEGIGLSIVKRLCELLRASLEIESKPGQGTLFRMQFGVSWKTNKPRH